MGCYGKAQGRHKIKDSEEGCPDSSSGSTRWAVLARLRGAATSMASEVSCSDPCPVGFFSKAQGLSGPWFIRQIHCVQRGKPGHQSETIAMRLSAQEDWVHHAWLFGGGLPCGKQSLHSIAS